MDGRSNERKGGPMGIGESDSKSDSWLGTWDGWKVC